MPPLTCISRNFQIIQYAQRSPFSVKRTWYMVMFWSYTFQTQPLREWGVYFKSRLHEQCFSAKKTITFLKIKSLNGYFFLTSWAVYYPSVQRNCSQLIRWFAKSSFIWFFKNRTSHFFYGNEWQNPSYHHSALFITCALRVSLGFILSVLLATNHPHSVESLRRAVSLLFPLTLVSPESCSLCQIVFNKCFKKIIIRL